MYNMNYMDAYLLLLQPDPFTNVTMLRSGFDSNTKNYFVRFSKDQFV